VVLICVVVVVMGVVVVVTVGVVWWLSVTTGPLEVVGRVVTGVVVAGGCGRWVWNNEPNAPPRIDAIPFVTMFCREPDVNIRLDKLALKAGPALLL